jgi:hypothetical protein
VEILNQLTISEGGIILRLYMKFLFTNVPMCIALAIVREHLNAADPSHDLSVLTERCVSAAVFMGKVKFYRRIESAAMGSLLSPL